MKEGETMFFLEPRMGKQEENLHSKPCYIVVDAQLYPL